MEKISHIVPASTRQVWVSGEVDKPRRVTEPNFDDRIEISSPRKSDPILASAPAVGPHVVASDPLKGGKLDMTA